MAGVTLRDAFRVNVGDDEAAQIAEQARAREMSAPLRAYAAGRINTDVNANLAQEASLRAAGQDAQADALAAQTAALQQRQGMYAPEVGKVENVDSIGSGLSWLGTQIGQGAASMQDPMALAAAAQGVGTVARGIPGLRTVGQLAPLAGIAGAYGINQRQMTGEMYGRLKDDPVAMDNMTPQEANRTANLYGLAAGALSTALPAVAGRALGGAALRPGMTQSAVRATSPLTRTAGGMALEGATELGEQELQIQAHNLINPNRDTSEDASERLNAFAGGAAGGMGPSALGSLASQQYSGVGRAGEVVRAKAGEVVDIIKDGATTATEAVTDAAATNAPKVKPKIRDVIDIGSDGAKATWSSIKGGGEDTNASLERARAAAADYGLSNEEMAALQAEPPADASPDQLSTWAEDSFVKRWDTITPRMEALAAKGDERAQAILQGLQSEDPVALDTAVNEAGSYLLDRNAVAVADLKAASFHNGFGSVVRNVARAAAKGATTVSSAVADAARTAAAAATEGVREGTKRSMQGAGFQTLDYDTWAAQRAKNVPPVDTPEAQRTHAVQKSVEGRSAKKALEQSFQDDPVAKARSRERAQLFAEIMAAEAQARRARVMGTVADGGVADYTDYVRSIGYEVADMAEAWAGRAAGGGRPTARDAAQAENSTSLLDSLAGDMILATGEMASSVVSRMAEGADASQQPFWTMLQDRVDNWDALQADRQSGEQSLRDQLVQALPQASQAEMLADGGKGAVQLMDFVQQISRGRVSPQVREAFSRAVGGEEVVTGMLMAVNGRTEVLSGRKSGLDEPLVDDGGVDADDAEFAEFEKRMAQRVVDAGAGASGYNFARTQLQSVRTPTSKNPDPFRPDAKTGKRPTLFNTTLAEDTAVGKPALEKKLADVQKLHEGVSGALDVKAKTLTEVFADLNYTDEQKMAAYRDYMRQEGSKSGAVRADFAQAVLDKKYTHAVGIARLKAAMDQFAKDHSVVVTERGTQRDRLEMDHGTVVSLAKGGDNAMSAMRREALTAGKRGTPEYTKAMNKALGEANILIFQNAEGKNLMGRTTEGDNALFIPADRIVKWVRSRGAEDGSTRDEGWAKPKMAHERYLEDLLSGMQSILGSGYIADDMPYMMTANGKKWSFGDGLPPNLRLGLRKVSDLQDRPKYAAELEIARARRLENYKTPKSLEGEWGLDARDNPAYQEKVAADQDREELTPGIDGDDNPRSATKNVVVKGTRTSRIKGTNEWRSVPITWSNHFARSDDAKRRDRSTPLDVTKDERYGNAKTEREDLADRTTNKAADLSNVGAPPKQHAVAAKAAEARRAKIVDRVSVMVAKENYESIQTNEAADAFIGALRSTYDALVAEDKRGDGLVGDKAVALVRLREMLDKKSTFDFASLYPGFGVGDAAALTARAEKALGRAAPEVAAKSPKSRSAPDGAPKHAIAHRVRARTVIEIGFRREEELSALVDLANDRIKAMGGEPRSAIENDQLVKDVMGRFALAVLAGTKGAEEATAAIQGAIINATGFNADRALDDALIAKVKEGGTLGEVMTLVANAGSLPTSTRAVARAVRQAAGDATVDLALLGANVYGLYNHITGGVALSAEEFGRPSRAGVNAAHTALHEGVHAATVRALVQDKELYQAVYALMDHVAKHDPKLSAAYGMTNVLEFVAESMSNTELQRRLYKIPASRKVEQYLGRTVANAWDGFVALVSKALNLPQGRNSALNQIIELSGRAMKATGQAGDTSAGVDNKTFVSMMLAKPADPDRVDDALLRIAAHPAFKEGVGKKFVNVLMSESDPTRLYSHTSLRALELFEHTLDYAPQGEVDAGSAGEAFGGVFTALMGDNVIAHRMSDQIHADLGNDGFGATHDSPVRHEGRFDWRKFSGTGEGQAAFGAGTYLSTADETHDFYKQQFSNGGPGFEYKGKLRLAADGADLSPAERMALNTLLISPEMTAEAAKANTERFLPNLVQLGEVRKPDGVPMAQFVKDTVAAITPKLMGEFKRPAGGVSPTYHVSVNANPTEIMGWDAPYSEQPWPVQVSMLDAAEAAKIDGPHMSETGHKFYQRLSKALGTPAAASEALQAAGLVGHAYDAMNGMAKKYPNYVIYDDARIKTNYVHFNRQKVNEDVAPDHDQVAQAKAYLNRVLGGQIKAEFKEITGYSGEWVEAENTVRVSTISSAGALDVARHEALHAFFSKFIKANPRAAKVFTSLTDDPRVMKRLEALLADDPAALAQLADGEERLAYLYQFAMAGVISLPHTAGTTLMGKVRKFLRRVFMMVSEQERAVDLLYAFEHGEMSQPSSAKKAIAKVLDQGTWGTKVMRRLDPITQRAAALTLPAETILAVSDSAMAKKIGKMFFTNPGDEQSMGAGGKHGYLNDRNQKMRQYDNLFRKTVEDLDDVQMSALLEAMQRETPVDQIKDPQVAEAQKRLRGMFERFHRYLRVEKGMVIGKINENYFPVVWDSHAIGQDPSKFADMLRSKYAIQISDMASTWAADRDQFYAGHGGAPANLEKIDSEFVIYELTSRVSRGAGVDAEGLMTPQRQDGVLRPWMAASKRRTAWFIEPEDRAPFLEKDLVKTLTRYVRQGVHTAEYAERFGRGGEKLDEMLKVVHSELVEAGAARQALGEFKSDKARDDWVRRQYRDVANAVGGMEGSLGNDVKDWQRNVNSWSIVYQNVRLLPLALFSSFVDPLGLVARGGSVKEAFTTFVEGIKSVGAQWANLIREEPADRQKQRWESLAEHAGVIDGAVFSHLIADEYGSVYLEGRTKKINELMFKVNGMEAWNRAMRVGATRSAVAFMERHAKLPEKHSERWLQELGLDPKALPMDSDGRLITDKQGMLAANPGMSQVHAEEAVARVHSAIVRWVEGAVLSPNAAQRPAWGSDPHYSMFWHLKQFAYSFHQTLIKRAMQEAQHGNYMPLGVFGWYIPTMIAADVTKGLMLGGGQLPQYMQGYDLGDWMLHGVDRAGVLGIGQVATDAISNPASVGGPMFEQILDATFDPVDKAMVDALPMKSLTSRIVA